MGNRMASTFTRAIGKSRLKVKGGRLEEEEQIDAGDETGNGSLELATTVGAGWATSCGRR